MSREFCASVVIDVTSRSGAILAIAGTLLGVLVANVNNRRLAMDAREHADRTRFHDKKAEVYRDLLAGLEENIWARRSGLI